MKKNFFLGISSVFWALMFLFVFSACEIGLGKAVDTKSPEMEFYEYPETDAKIRGAFTLGGTWSDDGVIKKLNIRLTNLSTKVYREYTHLPAESKDDSIGCDKDSGLWYCRINPVEENLSDGTYEAKVEMTDTYGHKTTITRSFVLDNTAPVLVLSRPTYGNNSSSFDSYGQEFSVEGYIGEATDKKYINVEIYDSADATEPVYSKNGIRVDSEFNITIAQKDSSDDALKAAYETIYGSDSKNGTKKLYLKVQAYDEALYYGSDGTAAPEGDAAIGNRSAYFYLYNDLYDGVFADYGAYDIYKMKSAASSYDEEVEAILNADENKNTVARFSINPANNPGFIVSGKNILKMDGSDFAADNEDYHISNGSTIVVEISPGLDETPLNGDTLGVYAVECDVNGAVLEGAEKVVIVPALKDSVGNVLISDENVISERKACLSTSGSTYKFKTKLVHEKGLSLGTSYVFGVYGCDKKGVSVKNLEGTYGFVFTSSVSPKISITSPEKNPAYVKEGAGLKVAGKVTTEIGEPKLTFVINQNEIPVPKGTNVITGSSVNQATGYTESSFEFTIPSTYFTSNVADYTFNVIAYSGGLETTATIYPSYDIEAPVVEITDPQLDTWVQSYGNVTVGARVTDNLSGIENLYYSTTETTWTDSNVDKWNVASLEGTLYSNAEIVSVDREGKQVALISFVAIDKAGNVSAVATRPVNVDIAKPALSNIQYLVGDSVDGTEDVFDSDNKAKKIVLASSSFTLSGKAQDSGTAVTVKITRDDNQIYNGGVDENGLWSVSESDLVDGTHTYKVTVYDESLKTDVKEFSIIIDEKGPELSFDTVSGYQKGSIYTFSGEVNEENLKTAVARLYKYNGADDPDLIEEKTITKNGVWSWRVTSLTENGSYYVELEAEDNGGLKTTGKSGMITVDSISPVISNISLGNGEKLFNANGEEVTSFESGKTYYAKNNFTVTAQISDVNYDSSKVELIINEGEALPTGITAPTLRQDTYDGTKWSFGRVVDEGTYKYQLRAEDKAENESNFIITVCYDTTAPVISITNPLADENIDSSEYKAKGAITENGIGLNFASVKYRLGDGEWTPVSTSVTSSNWQQNLELESIAQGNVRFSIQAADKLGNTATIESVNFYYDYQDPVTGFEGSVVYPTSTPATTASLGEYVKNGESFTLKGFAYDSYKLSHVTITDSVSNITYSTKATDSSKLITIGSAAVDAAVSYATAAKWSLTFDSSALEEGNHIFKLKAYDVSGRSSEMESLNVFIDISAPSVVSVVTPDTSNTEEISYEFTGTANDYYTTSETRKKNSDLEKIEIQITNKNVSPVESASESTGTTGWITSSNVTSLRAKIRFEDYGIFATEGVKTVHVRATDKAGNVSSVLTKDFAYDKADPVVTISSYTPNISNSSPIALSTTGKNANFQAMGQFSLKGTATDGYGVKSAVVKQKFGETEKVIATITSFTDGIWEVTGLPRNLEADDPTDPASVIADADIESGNYIYSILVTDETGKTDSITVTASVDRTPPTVTITKPETDTTNKGNNSIDVATFRFTGNSSDEGDGATGVASIWYKIVDDSVTSYSAPSANTTVEATWTFAGFAKANATSPWSFNQNFKNGEAGIENDVAKLGEGKYKLVVYSVDGAGNVSSAPAVRTFDVDMAAPFIETKLDNQLLEDRSTETKLSSSYVFKYAVTETNGLKSGYPQLTVKKGNTVIGSTASTTEVYYQLGTENGYTTVTLVVPSGVSSDAAYEYTIVAKDLVDKETTVVRNILLDTTAPTLSITSPDLSTYLSSEKVVINGFADDASGVHGVYYLYDPSAAVTVPQMSGNSSTWDSLWTSAGWTKATGSSSWKTGEITLTESSANHLLYVAAVDVNGKVSTSAMEKTVKVDQNAPSIDESFVTGSGKKTNGSNLEADGSALENKFLLKGTASDVTYPIKKLEIKYKKDGSTTSVAFGEWTAVLAAAETNTIAYDTSTKEWSKEVVVYKNADEEHVSDLVDGIYVFTIEVTDIADKKSQVTRTVVVDTKNPEFVDNSNGTVYTGITTAGDFKKTVTKGEETEYWYTTGQISVKGTVGDKDNRSDIASIEISKDGTNYSPLSTIKGGTTASPTWAGVGSVSLDDGTGNVLYLRATDEAGNSTVKAISGINIDTTKPVLENDFTVKVGNGSFESVSGSQLLNGKKAVQIKVKASDASSGVGNVTVVSAGSLSSMPEGVTTALDGEYYVITIPANNETSVYQNGTGLVTVKVTDMVGQSVERGLFSIEVDSTAPAATIDEIADADGCSDSVHHVNGIITVSGTASDTRSLAKTNPVSVVYKVTDSETAPTDWSSASVLSISGTYSWSGTINTASLTDEKYLHIKAVSTDEAGNESAAAVHTVKISQDTDRSIIRLTNVANDGSTTLTSKHVTGTLVDDDGNVVKMWYYPAVKTISDGTTSWSSVPEVPGISGDSWSVPSGWLEVDELTNNSFAINAKKNSTETADDGEVKWYFAVADVFNKVYTTANTNTLNQTKIVFDNGNVANNASGVSFKFDTTPPAINSFKILKVKSSVLSSIDLNNDDIDWTNVKNTSFGGEYGSLYVQAVVYEDAAMKASPIKVSFNNSDFDLTDKVSASVDSTGKYYTYVAGPFDMSGASTSADLKVTVYDAVDNEREEALTIIRDNEGPKTITDVKPKATEEISGTFTYSGLVSDNYTGVKTIQYWVPKFSEANPANNAAIDPSAITNWRDVTSKTTVSWNIEFIGDNNLAGSSYLDYRVNGTDVTYSDDYKNYDDNGDDVFELPVWFKLTDNVGNIAYVTDNVIKYNPNTDRPSVLITSPVHDQHNDVTNNGSTVQVDYVIMGGVAKIAGTAEDDEGIDSVYLQFDFDGDGNWDNGVAGLSDDLSAQPDGNTAMIENCPISYDKIEKIGSSSNYGIKVNGTKNWNYSIDLSKLTSPTITENKDSQGVVTDRSGLTLNVRAITIDNDTTNGQLISAWSNVVKISVNNEIPRFSELKVKQIVDGDVKVIKDYQAGMYLKGDNWYLTGEVFASGGISAAQYSGTKNVTEASGCFTTKSNSNWTFDMKLPVEPDKGVWNETISVTDKKDSGVSSNTQTISINVDNTPPEFYEKYPSVQENTFGTVKHYMDTYGSRGTPLTPGSVMKNSNGSVTIYGKVTDTGSKFEKAVFYFKRAGSSETRVYNIMESKGNSGTENKTVIDTEMTERVPGKVFIDSSTNGDNLPSLYVKTDGTSGLVVTRPDDYSINVTGTIASGYNGVIGNKNVRKGGLIKIGGVYRTITGVSVDGTITFNSACATSYVDAELVYAMVVDSNGESQGTYGVNESDGDGMLEAYSTVGDGVTTWNATIDSLNIPDGPIELHVVVFDTAGNLNHGYTKTRISNNPPRITKVKLGTDLNGSDTYDESTEFETFYAVSNSYGNDLTTGKEVWSIDTKKELGGNSYYKVKKGFSIIPEFVGGTGDIYYKFKKTVLDSTAVTEIESAENIINKITEKSLSNAESFSATGVTTNTGVTGKLSTAEITSEGSGNKAGKLELANSVLDTTTGEGGQNIYSFSFWDSTEESTVGTDTGSAVLNVMVTQNLTDSVAPKVVVDRFHWYGKGSSSNKTINIYKEYQYGDVKGNKALEGEIYTRSGSAGSYIYTKVTSLNKPSTDTADVYRKIEVPINHLYKPEEGNANGHIELEKDLPTGTFSGTSGLYDTDPKVSGKITFTGSVYDNVRIGSINFRIVNSSDANVFTPTGGANDGNNLTVDEKTFYVGATYASGAWTSKKSADISTSNNWKFEVEDDYFNQNGHKANWKLSIDTSKITGVAATDVKLIVYAEDAKSETPNGSILTDSTESRQNASTTNVLDLSDEVYNLPAYQFDVVPYITEIHTKDRNNSGLKDNNIRSASGKYSVIKGSTADFITVNGFNLNPTMARIINSSDVSGEINDLTGKSLGIGTRDSSTYKSVGLKNNGSTSGYLELFVNGIRTLNNINNNDANGSFELTGGTADARKAAIADYENMPNREADYYTTKNVQLNDDRYIRFFDMKDTGIVNGYYSTMIMNGDNPVFSYLKLNGGPSGASGTAAGTGAGYNFVDLAASQRREVNGTDGSEIYTEYLGKSLGADQMVMAKDEGGRYYHVTVSNYTGDHMCMIYDRYNELHDSKNPDDSGWIGNTAYYGYTGDMGRNEGNNCVMLDGLSNEIGRYHYPKIKVKGNSKTGNASVYMAYYDFASSDKNIYFRNFQIGKDVESVSTFTYYGDLNGKVQWYTDYTEKDLSDFYVKIDNQYYKLKSTGGTWWNSKWYEIEGYDATEEGHKKVFKFNEVYRKNGDEYESVKVNYSLDTGTDQSGTAYEQKVNFKENTNGDADYSVGRTSIITNGSDYYDIALTSDNHVVLVCFDNNSSKLRLYYTKNAIDGSAPLDDVIWITSSLNFPEYVGNYVSMDIDSNNGIHISAFDVRDSDLSYIYVPKYNSRTFKAVTVDQFGAVGNWTQIKLKNDIPYIAYTNASENGQRDAVKIAYANNYSSGNIKAGVDSNNYTTGAWEYMTVPAITPPQGGDLKFQNVCLDFDSSGRPVVGYLGTNLEFGKWLDE